MKTINDAPIEMRRYIGDSRRDIGGRIDRDNQGLEKRVPELARD
jgi:hypothetical protein